MNLTTLLTRLEKYEASGLHDVEITGLSYDSRTVKPGHLFAALPGVHHHGTEFLQQALTSGAAAILTDRNVSTSIPCIVTENPRLALAIMSNVWYQNPSSRLKLFGVTGTNGKTTSTFLFRSILENSGMRTGLLGTICYSGNDFESPAPLTTPESLDLQRYLHKMLQENCSACVMEVSSHSLSQYRVAGCTFEAAIFTNLTQDHLDYHLTMEDYFQAKWMLFNDRSSKTKSVCVNFDDSYGKRIFEERRKLGLATIRFGFQEGLEYQIVDWNSSIDRSELVIRHSGIRTKVLSPLLGRYNAYNIAGVFSAAIASGIELSLVQSGIEKMLQVPGRLEKIDYGQPFLILIDYAHTEDAFRQLLATVRPYVKRNLTILFGCGGERDRAKRPLMGKAAAELADKIILTSDNPRGEDVEQIIRDIRVGVDSAGFKNVDIFLDRKEAISYAIRNAEEGDVVVLAGKGHENYQMVGGVKHHFDEREILKEIFTTKPVRREGSRR